MSQKIFFYDISDFSVLCRVYPLNKKILLAFQSTVPTTYATFSDIKKLCILPTQGTYVLHTFSE